MDARCQCSRTHIQVNTTKKEFGTVKYYFRHDWKANNISGRLHGSHQNTQSRFIWFLKLPNKKTVQKCHFHFHFTLYLKLSCVRLVFYCEKLTGRNGSNDMLQRCWQIQCVDSSSSVRWAIDYLPRLIFWKRGITLDLSVAESLTASPTNLVPKWQFIFFPPWPRLARIINANQVYFFAVNGRNKNQLLVCCLLYNSRDQRKDNWSLYIIPLRTRHYMAVKTWIMHDSGTHTQVRWGKRRSVGGPAERVGADIWAGVPVSARARYNTIESPPLLLAWQNRSRIVKEH